MIFKYKVVSYKSDWDVYRKHDIIICEHTSRIFHWEKIEMIELRELLCELHKDEFKNFEYYSQIPEAIIYDVLKKYNSMDEIIMKYITDVILRKRRKADNIRQEENVIQEFVATNGWKTIEIKENEK